jgi:hypothetical protein
MSSNNQGAKEKITAKEGVLETVPPSFIYENRRMKPVEIVLRKG